MADQLAPHLLCLLHRAKCIKEADQQLRSLVRIASLDEYLFLHSSYPTGSADAVFLGPDTYRFIRFVSANLPELDPGWIVDMGAGSGAGGIIAGAQIPSARVTLVDIN